jgi:hypothetical protein
LQFRRRPRFPVSEQRFSLLDDLLGIDVPRDPENRFFGSETGLVLLFDILVCQRVDFLGNPVDR